MNCFVYIGRCIAYHAGYPQHDQLEEDVIRYMLKTLEKDIDQYTKLDFSGKLRSRFNQDDVSIYAREALKKYENSYGHPDFIKTTDSRIKELESKWFDIKLKFTKDIWTVIFPKLETKELGMMSSVSKALEIAIKNDEIWEPKCLAEKPEIKNHDNLPWKEIYKDMGLDKFRGGDEVCYHDIKGKLYEIKVRWNHPELTIEILKKLIIKKYKLECSLDNIALCMAGQVYHDDYVVAPVELRHDKTFIIRFK